MRVLVDATPDELRAKRTSLLTELAKALSPVDADLSDALLKALPEKEEDLKFPVLREISERTQKAYQEHLQAMLDDIAEVLNPSVHRTSGLVGEVRKSFEVTDGLMKAEGWLALDDEEMADELWKAQSHKYIRRVPYTDDLGHHKYRYYYHEASMGRGAQAGEEVSLGEHTAKVLSVGEDGRVHMEIGGEEKTVAHGDWHRMMAHHYGEGYYKHVEMKAQRAINAVSNHVPHSLLEDLKGGTDEERMADLKTRVPEIHSKLQAAFQRAGVNAFQAKQIIHDTMERRGWAAEARSAVLGSILSPEGLVVAKAHKQVIAGAENLAGGSQVKPKHVMAAIDLRRPRFEGDNFGLKVADIAKKAEDDLTKLQHLLHAAQSEGGLHAALMTQALAFSSTALQQLNMLATAYPGMKDRLLDPLRRTMMEVPSVAPRSEPTTNGAMADFFVAGEGGKPKAMKVRYRLMEAKDVVPSHDPDSFLPNPKYPVNVQERAYHRDKAEQEKVLRNASRGNFSFVINTNPDAVNGPPVVTSEGVVLGGNSRTMSMQRAYLQGLDQANEMKTYLRDHAHEVGLKPWDVDAIEHPILVRELELEDKSPKSMRTLVRQMNESFTQALDPRTYQVALGRRLDADALDSLSHGMQEDESLNDFLGTGRSKAFVDHLSRTGVVDERNYNQYIQKGTHKLNEDGKVMVARILVGNMVDDADVLSDTPPKLLNSIAGSVPYMLQAKSSGTEFDLSSDMQMALQTYNRLRSLAEEGKGTAMSPDMKDWQFKELFAQTGLFGEEHPITKNDRAMTLLELLVRKPGPRQMARVFREYTKAAAANRTDQMSLMGPALDPKQVLTFAIESASKKEQAEQASKKKKGEEEQPEMFKSLPGKKYVLRKAGGPYVGPRGGKWADPEMTIPWQEGGQTQSTQQPVPQVPQKQPVAPQAQPAGDLAPQPQQQQPAQSQAKVPQQTPVQMPQAQPAHPPEESEGELYQKLNGKLPAVKSTEEHIAVAKQILSQHQAAFQQTMGMIQQLAGQGAVSGRVKTLGSALKKLVVKPKYGSVDKLQDVTGTRVMHASVGEVKETVARLKAQFKVVDEEDYISQPQGNYRSYHLTILGPTGLPVEVQVRTKNQNTFADWAHNVYKPLTPEQEAHKNNPEVVNYAKTMADYFWDRDNGKQPSTTPNCTPLIQQTFGCMEIA